jgi:hypothetical protein
MEVPDKTLLIKDENIPNLKSILLKGGKGGEGSEDKTTVT